MNFAGPIRPLRTAVALASIIALCACGKKVPEGQVVAVVDDEEVTRRELTAEPEATGLPGGAEAQPALATLLGGVIDRKVAVAEARRLGLDRTPEFVAQSKRLDEVLLSRTLFDRWAAEIPAPGADALRSYAASHPQAFAHRKLLLIDRLEMSADAATPAELGPLQSMDEIAAFLQTRGRPFTRFRTVLDTVTMPLPLYRKLVVTPQGYPLALVQGNTLVALAVVESREAPLSADQSAEQASKAIRQDEVQRKLKSLRSQATIAYQAGYQPASTPTNKGAPAP